MSKSRSNLAVRGRGRTTDIIEITTKRDAVRRSKIAFWTVGVTVGVSTGVVAAGITTLPTALVIGLASGVIVGFTVALGLFCWPALRVAWHWAAELTVFTGLLSGYLLLVQVLPWWAALTILVAVLCGPLAVRPMRRFLVAWVWCAVTRHRLRLCFASFVTAQRAGSTPLILLARPIPAGERVWIWLRPGLALADLESRLDKLATGCWAAECRVTSASRRYAALLRIDIARRNPLTAAVASPLPGMTPGHHATVDINDDHVPDRLDLPDVPELLPAEAKRRLKPLTQAPAPAEPVVAPVRVLDDLQDWI
jgi:hypothetical protein